MPGLLPHAMPTCALQKKVASGEASWKDLKLGTGAPVGTDVPGAGDNAMTDAKFREICRAACLLLNIEQTDALAEGGDVFIDGVKVGMFRDEALGDALCCYVDIGSIEPSADTASILGEVLAINLELDPGLGESVGMERNSRHLVLRAQLPVTPNLDEHVLVSRLKGYAELVNELYGGVLWQITRPGGVDKL